MQALETEECAHVVHGCVGVALECFTKDWDALSDADGVTVTVLDRVTGTKYAIRAKYLYAADGGRSKVAEEIGLPFEGAMDIAGSMNITFKADIEQFVGHRPSVLYWVVQPGALGESWSPMPRRRACRPWVWPSG